MTMLHEKYLKYIKEHTPMFYNPMHKTSKLKDRLISHFGNKIQFWRPNYKSWHIRLIYKQAKQLKLLFKEPRQRQKYLKMSLQFSGDIFTIFRYIHHNCLGRLQLIFGDQIQFCLRNHLLIL